MFIEKLRYIFAYYSNVNILRIKPWLDKFWIKLAGHPSEFPLSARIFHAATLISILALGYNVPFNYVLGLPYVALACFVTFLGCCILYYTSRFLNKVSVSVTIFNLLGSALFIATFFTNGGLSGPADMFFLLFLLLNIAISPQEQYRIWIPLNILIVVSLHIIEYFYPQLVPFPYTGRTNRFVDVTSSYTEVALLTYFCAAYIRGAYEREKASTLIKSRSIQKKNLRIIKQNKELEHLNAEKNKLMSIIAHDLRSPLASIQNYLELLGAIELDDDQKTEIEKGLLQATLNTSSMLSQLLTWSKSQLHGIVTYPEYLDLDKILKDALDMERLAAERKSIALDYTSDARHTIYADKDMMRLVIRNLLGNAIKFTHEGGQINVTTRHHNEVCVICIEDNGIGVPLGLQQDLFSLKAQSTFGTQGEKGTGLGLLLCMDYIKAQNGKIWLESTPGQGSRFFIAIPTSPQNQVEKTSVDSLMS